MTPRSPNHLLVEENDRAALRWAGPFGYALLQVLRLESEHYGESDFQALMARGEQAMRRLGVPHAIGRPTDPALIPMPPPAEDVPPPLPTGATEPAPPPEWYRPVRAVGRTAPPRYAGGPTTSVYRPAGERDASGRFVKRI